MSNRPRLSYLLLLVLLLGVLAACVARLEEMGGTGSQGELQVMTPQPETAQPTETSLTEVATVEPTTESLAPTMPPGFVIPDTPTPWPEGFEPEIGPTASATPTMSAIVNLAEGLPEGEIYVAIVQRADGAREMYLLPVMPLAQSDNFIAAMNEMVNLGPQDVFVNGYPLATPPPRGEPPPNPTYEEETSGADDHD